MGLVVLLGNSWMTWTMKEKQHFLNASYASRMCVDNLITIVTHIVVPGLKHSSALKGKKRLLNIYSNTY